MSIDNRLGFDTPDKAQQRAAHAGERRAIPTADAAIPPTRAILILVCRDAQKGAQRVEESR